MFWDDIKLVTEQIEKYGLRKPMADLGGLEQPCIADYELTMATGDQNARYVSLAQRPFDHIDNRYMVLNPERGDPVIEDLPGKYSDTFGTAVCLNVIEHVQNPFEVLYALFRIMRPNGLLIISTVFSFPYHPSPLDYWRYSPACLRYLAEKSGFIILECDWRLNLHAGQGILNTQNYEPQEARSVFITLSKSFFTPIPSRKYTLPRRFSENPNAKRLLAES